MGWSEGARLALIEWIVAVMGKSLGKPPAPRQVQMGEICLSEAKLRGKESP
jgi:hypothetical protein